MSVPNLLINSTAFLAGFAIMAFEILSTRILAPYFGTSIIIWTSVLGTILLSMSLGYWWGGRNADRHPGGAALITFLLFAAAWMALGSSFEFQLLQGLTEWTSNLYMGSFLAGLLYFAPSCFALATVTPMLIKLKLHSLDETGKTVGRIYAISSIGSILGTFLAGYLFLAMFSHRAIVLGIASLLVINGLVLWAAMGRSLTGPANLGTRINRFLWLAVFGGASLWQAFPDEVFKDLHTQYSRYWLYDQTDEQGRHLRILDNGRAGIQAKIDVRDPRHLMMEYLHYFRLDQAFRANLDHVLMLGGGTGVYARDLLYRFPAIKIDLVEIDPDLTSLAEKYFELQPHLQIKVFPQDGRLYLNKVSRSYDVIYLDAFNGLHAPFHLYTLEAMEHIGRALRPGGLFVVNLVAPEDPQENVLIASVVKTIAQVMPEIRLFRHSRSVVGNLVNYTIVAGKQRLESLVLDEQDPQWQPLFETEIPLALSAKAQILRDQFSPMDHWLAEAI